MNTETKQVSHAAIVGDMYRAIASAICEHKNAIKLDALDTQTTIIISATVHHEDHGRMIGQRGATYQSLHLMLKTACDRMGKTLSFTQVKPPGRKCERQPVVNNPAWDNRWLISLVEKVSSAMFAYPPKIETREVGKQTLVNVTLHGAELVEDVRALSSAMSVVFRAIGFSVGRVIVFELGIEQ